MKLRHKYKNIVVDSVLLIILAFLCTVIALNGKSQFFIAGDGIVHLGRFEQIVESIKHLKVPSEISFIGSGHNLTAFISCYPWLSSLIFIFPRLFIKNIVICFIIGYFMINLLTGFNIYLLARKLTKFKIIIFSAVTIWLFNSYHLILLYSRMAFGEVLAYAFLPLVILGYILIYSNKDSKRGVIYLTIGMSGIANSHFITLGIVSILVVLITIGFLCLRKMGGVQIRLILLSGILSVILSLYSLYGYLHIILSNSILMPYKSLNNVDLKLSTIAQSRLIISQNFLSWNVGIIVSITCIVLIILSIVLKNGLSILLSVISILLYLIICVPLSNNTWLVSKIGFIQFQGRLLTFLALIITINFIITFNLIMDRGINSILARCYCGLIMAFMIIFSAIGLHSMEYNNNPIPFNTRSKNDVALTNNSYLENIYNPTFEGFFDYLPGSGSLSSDPKIGKVYIHGTPGTGMTWRSSGYNYEEFNYYSDASKLATINLAYYRGVNYQIYINNQKVANLSNDKFLLRVPKGNSVLLIKANPSKTTRVIFWSTMISNVLFFIGSLTYFYRSNRSRREA